METIFYSWQSDISTNINRNFIRDALEKAIKKVTESLDLDEAPRLDQDTSGVPGSPEIANSILKKIQDCAIFVPDLTIVAHTDTEEPSPNPNVLIEYGYALKAVGSERIVSIMNEYFGNAGNSLPFDMKHRRWPIRYKLSEKDSQETRKTQKKLLVSQIEEALNTIIQAGVLERKQELKEKTEYSEKVYPVWKSSSFLEDREIVAKAAYRGTVGEHRDIIWFNGPQAFLRIIPINDISSWTPFQLEKLINSGSLVSMGDKGNADWILRNHRGAVHISCYDNGETETYLTALGLSQVFRHGEIWGIEGYSLREEYEVSGSKVKIKYIAASYIENLFTETLQNYIEWVRSSLELELPLKYILGLSGINEYAISVSSSTIDGYCVEDEVIKTGVITDYDLDIADILIPFFRNIWESCGVQRPDTRR